MFASPSAQPLLITIRFSSDVADLPHAVSQPASTTVLALKHQIRTHLPPSLRQNSLRLIHAGKVLPDTATLSSCLRLPVPPPPRWRNSGEHNEKPLSDKARGKQPDRGESTGDGDARGAESLRAWIHCAISDIPVSPTALAAEAAAAHSEPPASADHATAPASPYGSACEHTSTTPAPQGFDRLLTAGFTPADVADLRAQLRHDLSFTHTPDTMPTGRELLAHEERWLESSAGAPTAPLPRTNSSGGDNTATRGSWLSLGGLIGSGNAGTNTAGIGLQDEDTGHDDNFYGSLTGFFWPVGAFMFGYREEGVWSRRRWFAVVAGIVGNLVVGFLRMSG